MTLPPFENGSFLCPDLASISDLRILIRRAYEFRAQFEDAPYIATTDLQNHRLYFDHCCPGQVFDEYYRVVHPTTREEVRFEKKASLIDHPLKESEIERHINRLLAVLYALQRKNREQIVSRLSTARHEALKRRVKVVKDEVLTLRAKNLEKPVLGGSSRGRAGVLHEGLKKLAQSDYHEAVTTISARGEEQISALEQGLQGLSITIPRYPKQPHLTIAKSDIATLDAAPARAEGEQERGQEGVHDTAAPREGWNLVEATEKGYDCVAEEDVPGITAGGDEKAGQFEASEDWDLCE